MFIVEMVDPRDGETVSRAHIELDYGVSDGSAKCFLHPLAEEMYCALLQTRKIKTEPVFYKYEVIGSMRAYIPF